MNRRLRVLLVGRHFWPHGSIDSAAYLYSLAIGLQRGGIHVEVVTPRYASSWPSQLVLREMTVHRPAAAPRSDWSMGRYLRHLSNWLRDRAASYDVLLCDSIREESSVVVEVARATGCASVLRYGGWGSHSDWDWWQRGRAAKRFAALGKSADRVISKSAASHRALLGEGYLPAQIQRIDLGFAPLSMRTLQTRHQAREALGKTNRDLIADSDAPVVLACGRMTRQGGIQMLVKSARWLINRHPDLRIWLIGEGPDRDTIHEYLRSEGVRNSVAIPGSFCDLDDIYAAADVYVQADDDGLDWLMPTAVSAEIPLVCVDSDATRSVFLGPAPQSAAAGQTRSLVTRFADRDSKSFRRALKEVIDNLQTHRERAVELRKLLVRTRPQSGAIESYVRLLHEVAQPPGQTRFSRHLKPSSRSTTGDSSVEAAS